MNYYPFHIGDYSAHTGHLTPLEDIAYRRCLDWYYLHEKPLPADLNQLARLIRMRESADIVASVVREFFRQSEVDDCWYHDRADAEIESFRRMAEGGRKGAAKRWAKDAESLPNSPPIASPSIPQCQPEPEPEPITNNQNKKTTRASASISKPAEVPESVWIDFLAIRKAKKAPLTQTALQGIEREAGKLGISLADALGECCARGWQGFKAEWMQKGGGAMTKGAAISAHNEKVFDQLMREDGLL